MTTTIEQKAGILARWEKHRSERGMSADIRAQCLFNWPSSRPEELEELIKAYQRRKHMHPSAPRKLAKYVVRCELGHRKYIETFTRPELARAFVDRVMGGLGLRSPDKPKWKSPTTITAKDGVLVVECEELEELMDMDTPKIELPDPMPSTIAAFLGGHWKKNKTEAREDTAVSPPRTKTAKSNGLVTLAQLCEKHGWEPRVVRSKLRSAKWQKPQGGWGWPAEKVGEIVKLMK